MLETGVEGGGYPFPGASCGVVQPKSCHVRVHASPPAPVLPFLAAGTQATGVGAGGLFFW